MSWKNNTRALALMGLLLLGSGCGYIRNVRDDFLDLGTFAVGVVPPSAPFSEGSKSSGVIPPAYGLYIEATDFLHLGALYKATGDLEWDRRGLAVVVDERTKLGFGPAHQIRIHQTPTYANAYKTSGNELDGWRQHMASLKDPLFSRSAKQLLFSKDVLYARPPDPDTPPEEQIKGLHRGWQDWETVSIEIAIPEPFLLHTGFYLRAGFDPSQIFDLVLGLVGLDLYDDNAYTFSGELRHPSADAEAESEETE